MIQLLATLHKVSIDSEAESTITLKIPATSLDQVTRLTTHTEQLLKITIEVSDKKTYEITPL